MDTGGVYSTPSDPEETLKLLGVDSENGLTKSEAEIRLDRNGPNSLPESGNDGFFHVLIEQVREPMILILIVIGLIYLLIGTPVESVAVIVIVFTVIAIEIYNVRKARISILALRSLVAAKAWVIRNGVTVEVPVKNIVPGDVVLIHAGERIPADGIILECFGLEIDESSLTGESNPVHKQALGDPAVAPGEADRYLIMSGTLVVQGSGKFAVVYTGVSTELGKVSESVRNEKEPKTQLEISLGMTSRVLIVVAISFSFLIPLVGFLHGNPLDQMILTGLSMAFATVPEELPILITITLAVGAYSLSRKRAIVKGLKAAQTLGSVSVIATDKTGTITENRMRVGHMMQGEKLFDSNLAAGESFLVAGVLSTGTLTMGGKSSEVYRDPMEISIFDYASSKGIDFGKVRREFVPENEFAFDSSVRLASYIYKTASGHAIFTSGAPEAVLERCTGFALSSGIDTVMTEEHRTHVLETVEKLAGSGERTMAISYKSCSDICSDRSEAEKGLVFLGLFSFIDPPKKGVREAIRMCQNAGIRVIMLTGDHPGTASAIGAMVGIGGSANILTGDRIRSMSDADLSNSVENVSIFARITHGEKLRIVRALQKLGETVAVTGDGVNDAPALRAAEIGIAMGMRGTDVAKEASDMILEDDNFQTIAEAVFEGRKMQYTLRKGIRYYIAVKLSLISILLVPILLVIPFPFLPIQIIIMELFMDVGALWGFLYENDEAGIAQKRPQGKGSGFITREMIYSIISGSAGIFLAVTVVYLYLYYANGNVSQAQTGAFATWILSQVILAQNLRTEYQPIIKKGFFSNPIILAWGIIIVGMLVTVTLYSPLHSIIDTSTLGLREWLIIVTAAILSTSWMEIIKFYRRENWEKQNDETAS
ncbi:MAG: cation-transporting P-type ATPase [Candidatus Thermoplasmatota archaeon]|nr:cation-transporting P-type ATPase [Candidatus Thermoplasmatota archaeon]